MNPVDQEILTLLFKGALFSAAAVSAGWLLAKRCSAQTMSLYWRGTALGLIALPLVAIYLPWLPLFESKQTAAPAPLTQPTSAETEWRVSYPDLDGLGLPLVAEQPSLSTEALRQDSSSTPISWILFVWLIGSAVVITRWARARLAASCLARGAAAPSGGELSETLRSFGVSHRQVIILISPNAILPMVWGSFRPVLLLPREALEWDAETRRAVLAHELAHVRRHDPLFLMLSQFAVALHWANPLAWIAARRLRLADERSADDSVLAAGGEAAPYARLLLQFAKRSPVQTLGLPLAAPSMAQRSTVGLRVERLLDAKQSRGAPRLRNWLGGSLITLSAAFAVGALTTKDAEAQTDATAPLPVIGAEGSPQAGENYIEEKLKSTIIPSIKFDEATLEEAVDFLRRQSIEHDPIEKAPEKKGVNIVIRKDAAETKSLIFLSLSDIPLTVALKYVAELAGVQYRVSPIAVVIGKDFAEDPYLQTFRVPPDFADRIQQQGDDGGAADDPFGGDPAPRARARSIKEALENRGVDFPEGASAFFNPATSSLVVRNTQQNIDLVAVLVEELEKSLPGVIKMRVELYEMPKADALKIITAADTQPAAGAAIASVRALVESGDAQLLASPSLITRSGQRAKIEAGESFEYVSSYREKDGKDVPVTKHVLAGTSFEVDPVVGADGSTLDINIAISMARGKPKITKRKMVGPASGLEREVESVAINQQQLSLAFTTLTGQTQLIGNLQSNTVDDPNAVLAFVTATVTRVKPE